MVEPAIFGPIDTILAPVIEHVILVLVLANLVTRFVAYQRNVRQADEGAEAISRYPVHEASNVLLVLASFYYTTLFQHSGIVLSMLVLTTIGTDVLEFEARKVEARQDWSIEAPKGAIVGSLLVLAYSAFLSLFFIIEPLWNAIV